MVTSPRVNVVGGGVIGTALAWRLAEGGAEVRLFEASSLASGTSSTSFAWLNANNKQPLPYHRLNQAGVTEHIRLREELGFAPWLHLDGNLVLEQPGIPSASEPDVPVEGERLADRIQRLREWNYPLELRSRADLERSFPDLRLSDEIDEAVFFPMEGYADVPLLVASLADRARSLGATIETDNPVIGFLRTDSRFTGVVTADRVHHEADVVVTCTGRWTEEVLAIAGFDLPMRPTLGLLALTSAIASSHRAVVHAPGVNIRPDGGGRFMLANVAIDDTLQPCEEPASLMAKAESLLPHAARVMPALANARIGAYRLGIRSIPADRFPVVGPVPGADGLHVVVTHSGVTMGPLLARLTASEILEGRIDDRLASFRPGERK